jgi:hypothetical protein
LHVPAGLRSNINTKRLEYAAERIIAGVQALVPTVFPWADRLVVSREWSYRWSAETDELQLPATDQNTVVDEPDAEPAASDLE